MPAVIASLAFWASTHRRPGRRLPPGRQRHRPGPGPRRGWPTPGASSGGVIGLTVAAAGASSLHLRRRDGLEQLAEVGPAMRRVMEVAIPGKQAPQPPVVFDYVPVVLARAI